MKKLFIPLAAVLMASCSSVKTVEKAPFAWEGANLYFLVTDRFNNGDTANDVNFNRTEKAAVLRGFEGGDLRGIIKKIDDNYFSNLGINAIWMTPVVEQIHGVTDEGTGLTYAYHGYWAKDWSEMDPNFGTKADMRELVEKAHKKGIRIVLDAVINHTGPVTPQDPAYPANWVRTTPKCLYNNYKNTTACTLVDNLPDVLTESNTPADLPPMLVQKWKAEGRYQAEMKSLDAFFARTGYPRAPKYYIMKWLSDYVTDFGIDGYRVDTAKHVNEDTWKDFQKVCSDAYEVYKQQHPGKVPGNSPFFTVGEVYGYGISQKQNYNFGDKVVDYYQNGFRALINFDFKGDANKPYEEVFSNYSKILHEDLKGNTVLNYLASHDDATPYDKDRTKTYRAANTLLLAPGISQIYYGDESARPLSVKGAVGDANLRSDMNWDDEANPETQKLLHYYQTLGKFRERHPAVGAGIHKEISAAPYWFSRVYGEDKVIVGLDLPAGEKSVSATGLFKEGQRVRDAFSGKTSRVKVGRIIVNSPYTTALIERD